jgi:predicted metalloprotease with PDZ domain
MNARSKPVISAAVLIACLAGVALAAPPVKLRYTLNAEQLANRQVLHVTLDIAGIAPNGTKLVLPSSWGEGLNLQTAVLQLRPVSKGLTITDTPDSTVKRLHGAAGGNARIAYDLVKDWDGVLREAVRHRAHLEPEYLEINTRNALVHPDLTQPEIVDCGFTWELPPGWSIATSFGSGSPTQRFLGPWDAVHNAVFAAGDFRLHRSKLGRGSLVVAIRGKWAATDEWAISQIEKIIRLQRAFWHDGDFPYYLVTLVPFGPGQSGSGGGGFTNAFSLHTSSETPFSGGFLSLMSHEMFHTWNPFRLGRMSEPSEGIYWFTEGFTTYYQDLLLWRAGLLGFSGYLESVNRILRDYSLSPAKNVSLRELIDRSRDDRVKGRISYERGALIALWLDTRIRQRTNAKSSLDDMMFDLFQEARRKRLNFPVLTKDRVLQTASRYLSGENQRQLQAYVDLGTTIEAPPDSFGKCATREMVQTNAFELGMNRDALIEKHVVTALQPGSEAQRSGLQEGDRVTGTSVYWNNTSKPVKLTVRRGDTNSTFQYFPLGPSLGLNPQYKAASLDCQPH